MPSIQLVNQTTPRLITDILQRELPGYNVQRMQQTLIYTICLLSLENLPNTQNTTEDLISLLIDSGMKDAA